MSDNPLSVKNTYIENQQKYIAYLIWENPQDCLSFDDKYFLNHRLSTIFISIKDLVKKNIVLEVDVILDECKRHDSTIDYNEIKLIIDSFTDFENIEYVKNRLKEEYIKQKNIKSLLEDVFVQLDSNGDIQLDKVGEFQKKLSESLLELNGQTKLKNFPEIAKQYRLTLHERKNPTKIRSIGFPILDKLTKYPGAEGTMSSLVALKGHGKCTSGDTIVLTDKGFKEIHSFSNNIDEFSNIDCNILTKDGIKHSNKFYQKKVSIYYKIKTKFGFEIKCTPEHPIYSLSNDMNYDYIEAQNLKIGDSFPILQNTNIYNKSIKEIEYKCIGKDNIKIPKYLTKDLSRLLGYYIANGSYFKSISTHNKEIQKDIKKIINGLGVYCKVDNRGVYKSSIDFINLLKYLCGYDFYIKNVVARYKEVPIFILEGNKENQIEFLKGLIDCDSYITSFNSLEYYTASKKLVSQVQLLLLNLGIFSYVRSKYNKYYDWNYYTLIISSEDFDKYKELIEYKSLKYEFKEYTKKRNTNIKIIPYLKNYVDNKLQNLRTFLKVSKNGVFKDPYGNGSMSFSIGSYCSLIGKSFTYYNIDKILDFFNKHTYFHIYQEVQDIINMLNKVKNSNYIYDFIESIEIVNKDITVYDFCVEDVHNFYSNGLISHNTIFSNNQKNYLVNKGICVLEFQFDMPDEAVDDRIIGLRGNIPLNDLDNGKLLTVDRHVNKKISGVLSDLENKHNYLRFSEGTASIDEIDYYIYEAKSYFRNHGVLPDDEYIFIIFDTVEMIQDFVNSSGVQQIKNCIEKLHVINKKHNCHMFNLLQANENKLRGGNMFKKPEQLDYYTIGMEDIHGSSAYGMRSRLILSAQRPVYMKKQFFPEHEDFPLWEEDDDLYVIRSIKLNSGEPYRVEFVLDPHTLKLYPLKKDEG